MDYKFSQMSKVSFFVLSIFLVSLLISSFQPLYGESDSDIEYSSIRMLSKNPIPGRNVSMDIHFDNMVEKDGGKFIPLVCEMDAKHGYSYVVVFLDISDKKDKGTTSKISTSQEISLAKGFNRSFFLLPVQELKDGIYQGTVQVKYTKEEKPVITVFEMEKISSRGLEEHLNSLAKEINDISSSMEGSRAKGIIEAILVRKLLEQAQNELLLKEWDNLSDTLNVLEEQVSALKVSFLRRFGSSESNSILQTQASVKITSEGILSEGKPVNLVGIYIDEPTMDKVKTLIDYSVPLVVFPITLERLMPSETIDEPIPQDIAEMMDTLFQNEVYVLIQLVQEQIPTWLYDKHPEINKEGFINLSQIAVVDLIEKGYEKIINRYGGNSYYLGVSLLTNPKFKFDGDVIRQSFIEWVKTNYPDRQTLNQIWHAHLASYDEITIWDELAPDWSYQNRRAYQYDWQNFHRDMIANALKVVFEKVRSSYDNQNPISVTFPSSVFELNETKFTPNREDIVPFLDFVSLDAVLNSENDIYAQGYPDPVVDVVWMRSIADKKPIVVTRADLQYKEGMTSLERYNHTQCFLWEMVLSGAQIVALNITGDLRDNVPVWKAISDANNLFSQMNSQLRQFQYSNAMVRILFSDSSKILDGGAPHLKSAKLAYEGSSFAGYDVIFATEREIENGALEATEVLIMPQTLSLEDDVFNKITDFIREANYVIRVGTQIPYDPKGISRRDVVQPTSNTVLVRGMNLPTEYLHGMDAILSNKVLPPIPRPVNKVGYPLEGVKSRFISSPDGGGYLYLLNLRKEPVLCRLTGYLQNGFDLVHSQDVEFPKLLQSLELYFIKLVPPNYEKVVQVNHLEDEQIERKSNNKKESQIDGT